MKAIGKGLRKLAPGESLETLLNPPPPPFLLSPPENMYFPSFEPITLISTSKTLHHGFPPVPPPARARPRPFAAHDIRKEDWLRFLHRRREEVGRIDTHEQAHDAPWP